MLSTWIVCGVICCLIVGAAKGWMDTLNFHYTESVPAKKKWGKLFWYPKISWINKYVDGDVEKGRIKWLGFIPKPVFLTDGWHLCQAIAFLFLSGAFLFLALASFDNGSSAFYVAVVYSLSIRIGFYFTYK